MNDNELDEALMNLYDLGLVELEYNENLEVTFKITEKGQKYLDTIGDIFRD